jgi:hypothetical protein
LLHPLPPPLGSLPPAPATSLKISLNLTWYITSPPVMSVPCYLTPAFAPAFLSTRSPQSPLMFLDTPHAHPIPPMCSLALNSYTVTPEFSLPLFPQPQMSPRTSVGSATNLIFLSSTHQSGHVQRLSVRWRVPGRDQDRDPSPGPATH